MLDLIKRALFYQITELSISVKSWGYFECTKIRFIIRFTFPAI